MMSRIRTSFGFIFVIMAFFPQFRIFTFLHHSVYDDDGEYAAAFAPQRWDKEPHNNLNNKKKNMGVPQQKKPAESLNQTHSLDSNESPPAYKQKWAYSFLIGGALKPNSDYKSFLYSAYVITQFLKNQGSKADFVLMVQISCQSNATTLPNEDVEVLDSLGIRIKYLPKVSAPVHEHFYSIVMEKFRILSMTEYSRVLFMDLDVMPRCPLDYLFELSDPPNDTTPALLKENVIMGFNDEPCNSGFFMLKPNAGDFENLLRIIERREKEVLEMHYPWWDEVKGWGHVIEPPDYWKTPQALESKQTNWSWHASFADQGLLYYWTKYIKNSVSIIEGAEIEHWGVGSDGKLLLENTTLDILQPYSCKEGIWPSPYKDFVHFTGPRKPWTMQTDELERLRVVKAMDARLRWWDILQNVSNVLPVPLSFNFTIHSPPVGSYSTYGHLYHHVVAKSQANWSHYEKIVQ